MTPLPISFAELEAVYAETVGIGLRTVAITSPDGGEGVSTLAYALARRATASGLRTLLVDLNQYAPSLHHRLALAGLRRARNALGADAIVPLPPEGFCVLPAPLGVDLATRDAAALAAAIAAWRAHVDVVIVDTSPVNRSNRANIPAATLCAACDGTVLVVMADRTPEPAVVEACEALRRRSVRLIGTVINDRHAPRLVDEIAREIRRLDRWAPRLADRLERWIRRARILRTAS